MLHFIPHCVVGHFLQSRLVVVTFRKEQDERKTSPHLVRKQNKFIITYYFLAGASQLLFKIFGGFCFWVYMIRLWKIYEVLKELKQPIFQYIENIVSGSGRLPIFTISLNVVKNATQVLLALNSLERRRESHLQLDIKILCILRDINSPKAHLRLKLF